MIEADIRAEILADSTVAGIIGSRFFYKEPVRAQTQPYIIYFRQGKSRDMIAEKNIFQIWCFTKDTQDLEVLARAVIASLENKKTLNGNSYYSNSLISQSDSRVKLDDGFFWATLTFEFKNII